jgi:hypothetical protein
MIWVYVGLQEENSSVIARILPNSGRYMSALWSDMSHAWCIAYDSCKSSKYFDANSPEADHAMYSTTHVSHLAVRMAAMFGTDTIPTVYYNLGLTQVSIFFPNWSIFLYSPVLIIFIHPLDFQTVPFSWVLSGDKTPRTKRSFISSNADPASRSPKGSL